MCCCVLQWSGMLLPVSEPNFGPRVCLPQSYLVNEVGEGLRRLACCACDELLQDFTSLVQLSIADNLRIERMVIGECVFMSEYEGKGMPLKCT